MNIVPCTVVQPSGRCSELYVADRNSACNVRKAAEMMAEVALASVGSAQALGSTPLSEAHIAAMRSAVEDQACSRFIGLVHSGPSWGLTALSGFS